MKTDGNFILGTARDIAEACMKNVKPRDDFQGWFKGFQAYDFSVVTDDYKQYENLEDLALSSEGWYGVKKIDTGFDSLDLTVAADYYGGLNPIFRTIEEFTSEDAKVKIIENMIIAVANYTDKADKATLFIAESCV